MKCQGFVFIHILVVNQSYEKSCFWQIWRNRSNNWTICKSFLQCSHCCRFSCTCNLFTV